MHSPGTLLVSLLLNRALAPLLLVTGLQLTRAPLVHVYILLFLLTALNISFSSTHWSLRAFLIGYCWAVPTPSHHPSRLFFP